jgi:two-component sensor histidine kinase
MQTRDSRKLIIHTTQIIVWAGVFLAPALITWSTAGSFGPAFTVLKATGAVVLPLCILYFLNFFFLVPKYLFGGKPAWFYLSNALLLVAWNLWQYLPHQPLTFPQEVIDQFGADKLWAIYAVSILMMFIVECLVILLAVGARYVIRTHEALVRAEEERRKSTEAELTWLKNQLNPHFLFNTLNNISSLTQIDPDQAQERIGQLSDALRYALYDSEAETVPLSGEVSFMENYIDLMALRCNERTRVERTLTLPDHEVMIAPLLFISLIENAFKHGVSARNDSVVHIDLHSEGNDLCFVCENTLFEKGSEDRSGSGIGLVNLRRRLELIYPGRYEYQQSVVDGMYRVEIRLKNLL